MKYFIVAILILLVILSFNCGGSKYLALDDLKYDMTEDSIEVLNIDSLNIIPPPDYVELSLQPQPVYAIPPVFPEEAKSKRIEGTVWVKMWITKNGNVKRGVVMRSESKILNRAALQAAIQWHFSPAKTKSNQPSDVWVAIPFKFILNR